MTRRSQSPAWRRRAARLLMRVPRKLWASRAMHFVPLGASLQAVKRSGLFDAAWYVSTYPDVDRAAIDPLVHFVCYGAYEGRWPNRFFDTHWYVEQHGAGWAGRRNPLEHYIRVGAAKGLATSCDFDTRVYREANADVARSGLNPLLHYLKWGWQEGRRATGGADRRRQPKAPLFAAFAALARRKRPAKAPRVDVIVPVYRGYDETLVCLHSVLAARVETPFELIVIDDASPDHRLREELGRIARLGLFRLLHNAGNLGFVRTANRGMALNGRRDVVLLNADTEVFDGWLDRLAAHARGKTGTVTPFSNNATICSYPVCNADNKAELELTPAELDALMAKTNRGARVAIPTAVGFCMYIRRRCLAATGLFDAETFGRGYGEENDFCCRATALGFGHVLAGDVFVRHAGSVSFSDEALAQLKKALEALGRKHPQYFATVQKHIRADPQKALRRAVDLARLRRAAGPGGVCHVSHTWGGGIARHIADLAAADAARRGKRGSGSLILTPSPGAPGKLSLNTLPRLHLPNLADFDLDSDGAALAAALGALKVRRLVVHSLAGWRAGAAARVQALAAAAGVPYDFVFHDYMAFCPRINLVGGDGLYCGETGIEACRRCLTQHGSPASTPDIAAWRAEFAALIGAAARRLAPSADTAARVRRYLPKLGVKVVPHREAGSGARQLALPCTAGERLRVVIVGAIGPHKGSPLLLAMAADAERRRLPLSFVVIGHSDRDQAFLSHRNVEMTGRFAEHELPALMARHRGHLAFLPSMWPETYSYVLSACLDAGYRVMAFDLGAIAERLRARGAAELLLPPGLMDKPAAVNDALLQAAHTLQQAASGRS